MLYTLMWPTSGDSTSNAPLRPVTTSKRSPVEARFDIFARTTHAWTCPLHRRAVAHDAVPEDFRSREADLEARELLVVRIKHREAGGRTAPRREQQLLGGEIRFHRVGDNPDGRA